MVKWERVVDDVRGGECAYYVPEELIDSGEVRDVAVFDWSGTLIRSASGTQLVSGPENWIWTFESVPKILNELNRKSWVVVVISNQSAIREDTIRPVLKRFEVMVSKLDFIPSVFISLSMSSSFAKPSRTMWDMFLHLTRITPSPASFSVGDNSAGLSEDPQYNQGSTDILFARAIDLDPYVPSEIFPGSGYTPSGNLELVITVGVPGSGKSTFSRELRDKYGYKIIERQAKRYLKSIPAALKSGKSVVFDALNPSRENRDELISLGHDNGARVVVAWATRPGRPYNALREGKERVPDIVYNKFSNDFQKPDMREGMDEIVRIN